MAEITPDVSLELPRLTPEELEAEFLPAFQSAYKAAPFLGEIYEWAKEVELPVGYSPPGLYDVRLSPQFIEPFKAIRDPNIRQVNIAAPPRSGKTLVAEITLLYLIANAPGHILWIQSTEASMKKMGDARMSKLLRLCPSVAKLIDKSDRHAVTQKKFRFANGMEVHLENATLKSLQSFGYKYIIFDEIWMADKGLLAEAKARIDLPLLNTSKVIVISQGGTMERPDWEWEFNRAPVKEYAFRCPKCNHEQLYVFNHRLQDRSWAGLVWPRNEQTYKDGEWDIEAASKSAELVCVNQGCKHHITDTPENRDCLDKNSFYLTTKAAGNPKEISFRFNALSLRKVSFEGLTREWLEADKIQIDTGDTTAKEKFYQKRMAQTWGTQKIVPLVDLNIFNLPDGQTEWKKDAVRYMGVDVQRKAPRLWWVVRECGKDSESRKIAHGTAHTWEELYQLRELHQVKVQNVLVDSGDNQSNSQFEDEVFTQCAKAGYWGKVNGQPYWFCYTATKGSGQWQFKESGNRPFKLDFQRPNLGPDPKYKGVPGCRYVVWSNFRIKRMLEHLRDGKGAKWLSNDDDPEYKKQIASEVIAWNKGKPIYVKVNEAEPNEYWDCEVLITLAMVLSDRLTVNTPAQPEATKEQS